MNPNIDTEAALLDKIDGQIRDLKAARERGQSRSREILQELRAIADHEVDGRAAAQALIEGGNVALAAPQEGPLREEQLAIRAGLDAIARELVVLERERSDVTATLRDKVARQFDGEVHKLAARAKAAAAELASVYADTSALAWSAGHTGAEILASQIRDPLFGLAIRANIIGREHDTSPDLVRSPEANRARALIGRPSTRSVAL